MKNKTLFSFVSGTLMLGRSSLRAVVHASFRSMSHCPATAGGICLSRRPRSRPGRGTNQREGHQRARRRRWLLCRRRPTRGFLLKDGQLHQSRFSRCQACGRPSPTASILAARSSASTRFPSTIRLTRLQRTRPSIAQALTDPACIKGFHYWRGEFSTVMFPATVDENGQSRKHPGAIAQRITPDGDIYGCVHDHDLGPSMFGAAWTRKGTFSLTFNGGQLSDPMAVPMSMNNGATPGGGRPSLASPWT